jgi:hypothetical protein
MDMDDERLRAFVKEELDRREGEKQARCLHPTGSIPPGGNIDNITCDSCGWIFDSQDDNCLADTPSGPPSAHGLDRWHGAPA